MKVVLAGAFGKLGSEILKKLVLSGHDVIAAGRKERKIQGITGGYRYAAIDATDPETLQGLCDGADLVITTLGLTGASTTQTCYDVDYRGNLNLLAEAKKAGVKYFNYVSVIACDHPDAEKVPMMHAKYLFENELKQSGLNYVIYRPTGYFYDIVKVFRPFVEKGELQLLKGYGNVRANVVSCPDFADYIVHHMTDSGTTYEIGGKETCTYEEMGRLCFEAAGKEPVIKYVPKWVFGLLAGLPKIRKAGKHDIILFSQFTLSHDLVGKDITGESSFRAYIKESFRKEPIKGS